MKEYIKPELDFVNFETEQIADVYQGSASGVEGDEF